MSSDGFPSLYDADSGKEDGAVHVSPSPPSIEFKETMEMERTIVTHLAALVRQHSKHSTRLQPQVQKQIVHLILLRQGIPTVGTFIVLLLGCLIHPTFPYVLATLVVFVLYSFYSVLQFGVLRSRATELNARTLRILTNVTVKWGLRVGVHDIASLCSTVQHNAAAPSGSSFNSASGRAFAVTESVALSSAATAVVGRDRSSRGTLAMVLSEFDAALLASRSMRLVAARGPRGAFCVLPKCLLLRGMQRLDEFGLRWETYREGTEVCKLLECLHIIMERDAVMLRPLQNLARPPRLPNLRLAALLEEEVDTTDDSDGEREPRSLIGGRSTISTAQRMEYFVMRLFTLIWLIGLVTLCIIGVARRLFSAPGARSIGAEAFIEPGVVLIGLLPLNALLVNRVLYLLTNTELHWFSEYLLREHGHTCASIQETSLPAVSWQRLLREGLSVIRSSGEDPSLPAFLARSTVETLGSVTVVTELDSSGLVTDMMPLPLRLLVIKENPGANDSTSSSDEDERLFLSQKSLEATRQRKKDIRMQVRRKRFQEGRFTQMKLHPSPREHLAVEFTEPEDFHRNGPSVNAVCLCILMHALSPAPHEPASWCESFHFVDRTRSWAQSAMWIARAAGFEDSVTQNFRIIARILSVRTLRCCEADSVSARFPDQMCALLCRDGQDQAHVFLTGTTKMLLGVCTSYWTGKDIEEFDEHEKEEVAFFAQNQWSASQGMTSVSFAHRVLPDRYQKYVTALEAEAKDRGCPVERYVVNDVEVTAAGVESGSVQQATSMTRTGSAEHVLETSGLCGMCGEDSDLCPKRGAQPLRRALSQGALPTMQSGVIEADSMLTSDTFLKHLLTTNHTLLGLVAIRDTMRPLVQSCVQLLDEAGIRFMHYGPCSEQRTKAFGDQIGLETDWNCCISLQSKSVALDAHSIRAQLPFGIPSIRKHILYVDPIPLQVNLFSHARGVGTRSMISVLQDNHEVVLAIGSLLNHSNTRAFVQADFAVGVVPSRSGHTMDKLSAAGLSSNFFDPSAAFDSCISPQPRPHHERVSGGFATMIHDVGTLLGTACSIQAGHCPNIIPIVSRLIRESRVMLHAMNNSNEFVLQCNAFVVIVQAVTFSLGFPLFVTPGSTLFILNVLVPLLAFGCHFNMHMGHDPMRIKQAKQNFDTRLDIFLRSAVVFAWRFAPTLVLLVVVPVLMIATWCRDTPSPWALAATTLSPSERACLGDVNCVTFLFVVWCLIGHSLTFLSRHQRVTFWNGRRTHRGGGGPNEHGARKRGEMPPFPFRGCTVWCWAVVICIIVTLTFTLLLEHDMWSFQRLSVWACFILAVVVVYPVLIIAMDVPIKRWRARRYADLQKFRTLFYTTRLGMHSPRGDYEPSPDMDEMENIVLPQQSEQPLSSLTAAAAPHDDSNPGVATHDDHEAQGIAAGHGGAEQQSGSPLPTAVPMTIVFPPMTIRRRLREFLFRWCSLMHGQQELQCVCCDHVGGHPAQYCA